MTLPKPEAGLVIRYAYLWDEEYLAGQEEGRKDRPCAIVLAATTVDDDTRVLVVPVTHRRPNRDDQAIELPAAVKRHLKLDDERSWIVLTESNVFTWPGPDLRRLPDSEGGSVAYGFLPPRLFGEVKRRFLKLAAAGRPPVPRTE